VWCSDHTSTFVSARPSHQKCSILGRMAVHRRKCWYGPSTLPYIVRACKAKPVPINCRHVREQAPAPSAYERYIPINIYSIMHPAQLTPTQESRFAYPCNHDKRNVLTLWANARTLKKGGIYCPKPLYVIHKQYLTC
jgi:hypothetical protein